ncbi:hypothetical protein SAMN05421878_10628 [Actinobaculum suis]|uniref:Probable cell division protein WhiA n=1 Tax=Actinobaculum suis TaxID=1657 RepID=A0A1B9BB94_9ACTO|nr:DNA-binding protein WhiA [Actinobaculum suis]MDY5153084.1 DNA-binding protein WhiA [Actinobaculum suis]OCA93740.1 DNA-binding protein WhiA [Actinobaculum suis]OCA94033.1 DNA-binding protein WhiA [Actinobaculum suis]SDE31866.1 hypothetical protein SAMN05421878_10628 [Actinobaculum suis]VDG76492.1 cytoplasmic protein [Actinobaculum suis]
MPALTVPVKEELAKVKPTSRAAAIAEISAMFRFGGGLVVRDSRLALMCELGHELSARRLCALLEQVLGADSAVAQVSSQMKQGLRYRILVADPRERFAHKLGLLDSRGRPTAGIATFIVGGTKADAAAAWRGAFLARGSLMEPGRNASLEVVCPQLEAAYGLGGLARRLDIQYRVREARGAQRVDIRGGEAISDMLARMGANDAVIHWEELRVKKEVQGTVNRLANFDDANMRRSANAAVIAVLRVQRAFEILGDDIPANLREAGEARVAFPSDSLAMLGERLDPPATKDAVAGRLRRLNALADKRAEELNVPTTLDHARAAGHTDI